jgi:hypothetical protein
VNNNGSYRATDAAPIGNSPRNLSGDLPQEEAINSPGQPLSVPSEPVEAIHVGAGGKLVVPREDLDADVDDGIELDVTSLQALKIRRPDPLEWIKFNPAFELTTRLLPYTPPNDRFATDYYFVDKALRDPIRGHIRSVRVFLYYSIPTKTFAIWIVNITPGNSWYESIATLFKQPAEFFSKHKIRVQPDTAEQRRRFRHKEEPRPITWPDASTENLLGEALGPGGFIRSADHPVYRDLVEGTELD